MAYAPQTEESLLPGISIKTIVSPSPFLGLTRNVVLLGFVEDPTELPTGTPINTPIRVGNITSIADAVSICNLYKFKYKFLSNTALDITQTDEIAAMLIYAGMCYQIYSPLSNAQQIVASQYIIGILDHEHNGRDNPLFSYVSSAGNLPQSGGYYLVPTNIMAGFTTTPNIPFSDTLTNGQYFTISNTSTISVTASINGCVFEVTEGSSVSTVTLISGAKMSFMKSSAGKYIFFSGLVAGSLDGGIRPYGDFFTIMLAQNIPCDIIAQPYQYMAGDSDSSVNYLSDLKFFSDAVYTSGNPNKGRAFALLANTEILNGDSDTIGTELNINNDQYSVTVIYPQPLPSTVYQIPQSWLCAFLAPILCGMQKPYPGFYLNPLNGLPTPDTKTTGVIYSDSFCENLYQSGYSTLLFNPISNIVSLSRLVVSYFTDAVTGIGRNYYLDYQDYCISFDYNLTVYRSLQARQIINERFFVNKDGSSDVLSQVSNVALSVAIDFYNQGMITKDPTVYAKKFISYLDKDNFSRIVFMAPLNTSSIIYQIQGTTNVQNTAQVLTGIAIGTQG